MTDTAHNGLTLLPATPVDWVAIYNTNLNKLEAGRTWRKVAGEALAHGRIFYIKEADGKPYIANQTTRIDGIWQSASTPISVEGVGQVNGLMSDSTNWSWTPGVFLYTSTSGWLTETPGGRRAVARALDATTVELIDPVGEMLKLLAGEGTAQYIPSGSIHVNTTGVGTDGDTVEKTLMTYTLPANSLSQDGAGVRVRVRFSTAANGNNKTYKLKLGSTTLVTVGPSAVNGLDVELEVEIYRTGASGQDVVARSQVSGSASTLTTTTTTEDETTALAIAITGQNGSASANDVVGEKISIELLPPATL